MNKEQSLWVLEACLLAFDGVTEQEMVATYCIHPKDAKAGILLANYLKSIKVESALPSYVKEQA